MGGEWGRSAGRVAVRRGSGLETRQIKELGVGGWSGSGAPGQGLEGLWGKGGGKAEQQQGCVQGGRGMEGGRGGSGYRT